MTERLTIDGFCVSEECDGYCQPCDYMGKILEKLSYYEDLEEQGRLPIVPKEFWDRIMEHYINDNCPFDYGLIGLKEEDCKVDDVRCKECWEKALKGE